MCTSCHDPHGSNAPNIMVSRMDTVCYNCHVDAEVNFIKTFTHQPVRSGDCSVCHDAHA
ncbi:MAG: cytochrome C, partial [Armatimonadetes bacterium]|nr:cytochrome C [Armatimonadota bacterium]NIO95675.1 cytochrome C [Armatimonadota bacterium]